MTPQSAIDESILRDMIVHMEADEDDLRSLTAEADDYVEVDEFLTEFWGRDDEGNDWRVHAHSGEAKQNDAWEKVREAAAKLVDQLNLFGQESIDELLAAAEKGREETVLDGWLDPECEHDSEEECEAAEYCGAEGFPNWFCDEAEPYADAFRESLAEWRRIRRSRNQ